MLTSRGAVSRKSIDDSEEIDELPKIREILAEVIDDRLIGLQFRFDNGEKQGREEIEPTHAYSLYPGEFIIQMKNVQDRGVTSIETSFGRLFKFCSQASSQVRALVPNAAISPMVIQLIENAK